MNTKLSARQTWDEDQLRVWLAAGHSAPYIAAQTGRPYDDVRRQLKRMGAGVRPGDRTHCLRRNHCYEKVGFTLSDRGHRICHACRALHSAKCKQTSRLNENRKRKTRTAYLREMESLETCPAGHSKRWSARLDGQCKRCLRDAAAATAKQAERLWTWEQWEILHDSEFSTPAHLRLGPDVKAWLIRNKVKPG